MTDRLKILTVTAVVAVSINFWFAYNYNSTLRKVAASSGRLTTAQALLRKDSLSNINAKLTDSNLAVFDKHNQWIAGRRIDVPLKVLNKIKTSDGLRHQWHDGVLYVGTVAVTRDSLVVLVDAP